MGHLILRPQGKKTSDQDLERVPRSLLDLADRRQTPTARSRGQDPDHRMNLGITHRRRQGVGLLPDELQKELPVSGSGIEIEKDDLLPGPEGQFPIHNRDGQ